MTGMPQLNPTKKLILAAALISAAVAFCVYIPSLGNGFVRWDDPAYVIDNNNIRSFDLRYAFTAFVMSTWLPLTILSFMLDYSIWGLNPFGYHLVNSILHSINTFMLALLAARLAKAGGIIESKGLFLTALTAGLLFGAHPVHVESVAWIAERKDVLNALFFLLGLHSYLNYSKAQRPAWYLLTIAFFTLSLLSKPMTVTMPLVLLILDFYPLERLKGAGIRRAVAEKLPFFGLSFAISAISIWSQSERALAGLDFLPFEGRLHIAARGFLFYIYKTLWPIDLAPLYPLDFSLNLNVWFASYVAGLLAITAFAVFMLKKTKAFLSAWAFYIITLVPVIGIIKVGRQAAADRYAYIPSMGLVILAGALIAWLVRRRAKAFLPALAALAAVSAVLSFLTVKQTEVWKNTITLWTQEIKAYPAFIEGYMARGRHNVILGKYQDALPDLNMVMQLTSSKTALQGAYFYRGLVYSNTGMIEDGIDDLTIVLIFDPTDRLAYKNRAMAYMKTGEYLKGIADFEKAASLGEAPSYLDLGMAYLQLGDKEKAYINLKKAVQLGDSKALEQLKVLEGN